MNSIKRELLINAIKERPEETNIELDEAKKEAIKIREKDDWLWHLLLSSMATMGNSRGYEGLIKNSENYNRVKYQTLLQESEPDVSKILIEILKKAKVRMPETKARWLAENFKFILSRGGIEKMQKELLRLKEKENKISFLKKFKGVGDKYARNMMMDIRDPDFIISIAIDDRIKDVSEILEIVPVPLPYSEHEKYYLDIAKEADITPWELDRLLYNNKDYFINILK